MLHKFKVAAVIDQRVAGDAGRLVIGFGETAVDDHQFAIGADRTLALLCAHGDMTVDNMALCSFDLELVKNHVADLLILPEFVVISFFLFVGFGIFDEIAFESGHPALVEERRVGSAPKIPIVVAGIILVIGGSVVVERGSDKHTDLMEELVSAIFLLVDYYVFQRPVGVERHRGMEEKV